MFVAITASRQSSSSREFASRREVQHIPVVVVFPDCGLHDREQEGQLEGTPPVAPDLLAAGMIGLSHLFEHRPVRRPERLGRERVGTEHLDAPAHAIEGGAHPVAHSMRARLLTQGPEPGGDTLLLHNPVGVSVGEAGEIVRHRRVGEACEIEDVILSAGVDGHHRHFGLGHEVGPDSRFAARLHLPARGGTMANGVDASFPVLKFELPLFVREQARVELRILDELASLHCAFEMRLEQAFPYPVSGPLERRCLRVPLTSIAQGDGENEPVPMRPRTDIDGGEPRPDSLDRLTGALLARPRDSRFR